MTVLGKTIGEVAVSKKAAAVRRRTWPRRRLAWLLPFGGFWILIGIWYLFALYYSRRGLAFLVPYPHLVFEAFYDSQAGALATALGRSTQVAVVGLVIATAIGVVCAMIMAQTKWIERTMYPYWVVLQCLPVLAIVPLIGALFGYTFSARVVVTVIFSVFPIVSNTLFGLLSADRGQQELFRLQGASRWTMLTRLQFPAALPLVFVGLRNAAGLAVAGAVVGDQLFQQGQGGLGELIQLYASRLQGPDMYAAIIVAALLGIVVFLLFGLLGRMAVGRWYDF